MGKDKFEDFDFIDFNDNHSQENNVFADIFATIYHYRKWFILSILIALIAGFFYIRRTPKTFSRTATVLVKDEKKGGSIGETAAFQDLFSFGGGSVDNEIGIFKSKRLMQEVSRQLHLEISYKKRNGLRKTELYTSTPFTVAFPEANFKETIAFTATMISNNEVELSDITWGEEAYKENQIIQIGDTTNTLMGKIIFSPTLFMSENYIGEPVYIKKGNQKIISDDYNYRLKVEAANKQSSLINLTIEDENINRAEDILNTLIEAYKNDAVEDKNKIAVNTSDFIKERLAIIEADLNAVDAEIEDYKKKNKLTDIISESSLYLQSTSRLDNEGLSVENQLNMAEYMKAYLQDNSKTSDLIPASIGINDNGIQNQINEYNIILTRRNKLIANSSVNNPLVQDLNTTLVSMRLSITKAVDNLIAGLKIQVTNMKNKERENMDKIAYVPTQQKYVISIERQQKIKEELYLYLLNKKEENELQRSITESNCRIIDPADGSGTPVSPKKPQVMLICLLLGFIIPALWIYIRSLLNTKIYIKKELKEGISIPFLGEIPLEKQKFPKDLVVKRESRDVINEAFRIIQDNLEFMNTDKREGGKVIQITSFNVDSGKTFVSINLAMSMALLNTKVVILDLDLRKGSLSKKSGIGSKQTGISNYLSSNNINIEEIIHSFDEKSGHLDIITSGPLPPNPAELLKSEKLDLLIAELRKSYDYILLDNPPYGLVVDTSFCARLADQTIYIIRSGLFDKRLLPEVQELYNSSKMRNMSIILNAVDYSKVNYGYEYGYGYGYGQNYSYENEEDTKRHKKPWYKKLLGS